MASFSVIGFVENIKPLPQSCLLFVSEYKKGYKKQSGEYVDDKYLSWKIVFGAYFKKYLLDNFSKGMLVEVKGEVFPYSVEHGEMKDGLSIIGQCCNAYSYPRQSAKQEMKMIKESQIGSKEAPDLSAYNEPDF